MKTKIYCIPMVLLLGGLSALCRAQVAPGKISQKRLQKSVQAVLGSQRTPQWQAVSLADSLKKAVRPRLKIKSFLPDTLWLGRVKTKEGMRYLIPNIAPSKSRRFSYVLYLDAAKTIIDVDVLKYRENYGYQIDYPAFRKQFRGKERAENVRFRRSIQNISGATISARSLTYSVHDLMILIQQINLK